MKRHCYIFIMLLVLGALASSADAEAVPMMDRHIFTPDITGAAAKEEMPNIPVMSNAALEKNFSFTGVMITPKGKLAILSETGSQKDAKAKRVYKEGDQVGGMTIKEIGPNYLTMVTKDKTMRMDLYKSIKSRPEPIAVGAPPQAAGVTTADAGKAQDAAKGNAANEASGQAGNAEKKEQPSPFGYGGQKSSAAPDNTAQQNSNAAANPLADILNKAAAGRNATGGINAGAFPLNK